MSQQSSWWAHLGWDPASLWECREDPKQKIYTEHRVVTFDIGDTFGSEEHPRHQAGETWTVPFDTSGVYQGGRLVVTVEVPVPEPTGSSEYPVWARHTWELRVRGERQTTQAEIRDAILDYVTRLGVAGGWTQQKKDIISAVLVGAACRENRWQHFCFSWPECEPERSACQRGDFKPAISRDGGYGLFQLTVPPPNVTDVWDWLRTLVEAERRFEGHYSDARRFFARHPGSPPTDEMLFRETLSRFNGGTYYRWDPTTST